MLTLLIILSYWWKTTSALVIRSCSSSRSSFPFTKRAEAALSTVLLVSATQAQLCHHNNHYPISKKSKNHYSLAPSSLSSSDKTVVFTTERQQHYKLKSYFSCGKVITQGKVRKMDGQQRQQQHQRSIPVPPPRRKSPTVVTTESSMDTLEDKDTFTQMPTCSTSYTVSSHGYHQSGGYGQGECGGYGGGGIRRITSELRISPPMMHASFASSSSPSSPTIMTTLSPQSDTGIHVLTRGGSERGGNSGAGGGFVQSGRPLMPSKSLKLHSTHRRSSQCRRFRKRMKAHRLFCF